jgi:type IV pilus assembly protein PilB
MFTNMPQFDDQKEDKKLELLYLQEEEALAKTLAETKYHIPYVDLSKVILENDALKTVPEDLARKLEVAPFNVAGKKLLVAVRAPEHDGLTELEADLKRKGFVISWFMASHASLAKAWDRYQEISQAEKIKAGSLDISGDTLLKTAEKIKLLEDIKTMIDATNAETTTHRVSKIIEIIFAGAIALGASDVHIEPEDGQVRLRIRLDGILHNITFIDYKTFEFINSRIKLLSGLKLAHNKAQDGRFSIFVSGEEISMRTSIIPGAFGEGIVMRILNPKSIQVDLEDMGIDKKLYSIISREIDKPNGLILITGPTGSGKSTSLYAFLRRIYSPEIKILTIEEPVEYHLEGITQTQTNPEKGYDFLEGLVSALRQDPDVVMVGEIRDSDTARIAVEASLTGHMVFSTLHTNNAAGVVPRLIDLGVNPKILASALSMAIAQRLTRKLCTKCKTKREVKKEEEEVIRKTLLRAERLGKNLKEYGVDAKQKIELWTAPGCPACNGIGYKGRIGVFEAIMADEAIQNIMPMNPSEKEIKEISEKQGILNMVEDGFVKCLNGITSIEELKKVVDIYEYAEDGVVEKKGE